MNALEKLREVTDTIGTATNGLVIVDSWTLVGRLLSRFPVDKQESARVLAAKDHAGLNALVTELENPRPVRADAGVSDGDMQAALKAFRKRFKLTRLDQESKLGGRYTSGGKKSDIDAIIPPSEFAPEVWRALEAAGKLRAAGGGFYAEVGQGGP